MSKTFIITASGLAIIGAIISIVLFTDGRYAFAIDHKRLESKVNILSLQDLKLELSREKYFLRNQSYKYPDDEEIKEKLSIINNELTSISDKIYEMKFMRKSD